MSRIGEFYEYQRGKESPEITKHKIMFKRRSGYFEVEIPDHGLARVPCHGDSSSERTNCLLENVLRHHQKFRFGIHKWADKQSKQPVEEAVSEVNAIALFFPDTRTENVRICMAAWLAVLCTVDNLIEAMMIHEAESTLKSAVMTLQSEDKSDTQNEICSLMAYFHEYCCGYLPYAAVEDLFREICIVFSGFIHELQFRQGRLKHNFETYMDIRTQTIGIAPFFSLVGSEMPSPVGNTGDILALKKAINSIVGLQNDLVGLEKDLDQGESMNSIILAMENATGDEQAKETQLADAATSVCSLHNCNLSEVVKMHHRLTQESRAESEMILANAMLLFTETHFKWCTMTKRYAVESTQA